MDASQQEEFFSILPTSVHSFIEATLPIMDAHGPAILAAVQQANNLIQENKSPLDLDKTAAICFYTQVHAPLNKALIETTTTSLLPWTKYIRLLAEALNALPNYNDDVVLYRVVEEDLQESFQSVVGNVICWAAFTSCTTSMSEETLSKATVFQIRCRRGKDIKLFNTFGQEVLLMATTKFKITNVDHDDGAELTMVHLDEVDTTEGYPLLNIHTHAVAPMPPSSTTCDKHNEKIKFLCHDCGDQLACIDCISTLPCSEHKRRMTLDDAIVKYRDEAQSNIASVTANWHQDLDKMKQRLDRVAADKQICLDETKAVFDKFIGMLDEMKQSHLQMIKQAADERCKLLDSRCKEIGKMIAEWDGWMDKANGLIAQSNKDGFVNNVDKLNAALQAKDASIGLAESCERLREWVKDEGDDKVQFVHNYESVGRTLESTIQKFKLEIKPSKKPKKSKKSTIKQHPVSIDLEILDGATQGKVDAVELIEMQEPSGLCRVSNNVIAVAELSGGVASLVSLSTRSIVRSFGQGILESPIGICMNHEGHFLVTDEEKHQIFMFDKDDGHLIKSSDRAKINLSYPYGICYDGKNHRVVVAGFTNHRVLILNEDLDTVIETIGGTQGRKAGQFNSPYGVGIDSKGRIVVSEYWNHRIQVFEEQDDPSAARGKSYRSACTFGKYGKEHGKIIHCSQLAVDKDDRIIVCDQDNQRVQVFESTGRWIGCTPALRCNCYGVCLDGMGKIVCSDDNSICIIGQ